MTSRRIVVTGGAGCIGFNYVRDLLVAEPATEVIVVDKLTYAGNPRSLAELAGESRLTFVRADIADKLNKEINAALAHPKMKQRLLDLGGVPMPLTPAAFGHLIADDTEKWAKVIRMANIKGE